MYRVSVTWLESYRRCIETEWGNPAELEAQIKGELVPKTWQAQVGTDIHALLDVRADLTGNVAVGRYSVDPQTFKDIKAACLLPPVDECLPEVKLTSLVSPRVAVVGKLDLLWANTIYDHKCKFSSWSPEDYERSLQWRWYLTMSGCTSFVYNILSFYEPKQDGELLRFKGGEVLRFWAYEGMRADCLNWLGMFLDWCEARGLLPYLEKPCEETF